MAHPASRVLAMLELLQAHQVLTGPELATRLGVDERTVRRYASTLIELGVPVAAARGRYGGYRLRPGYKLPPLMFTDDEAAAVALGLVAAQRLALTTGDDDAGDSGGGARTGGGGPGPAVDSAMAKLRRVLPASLAGRVAALTGALELTLARPGRAATASTGTLLALGEAVSGRHRVAIGYRSFSDKLSEREVDPYGLVFHAGRWYVTGLDHQSGELRTFRADRVSRVAARPEPFTPPAGFDPVGHVTRALAGVPYAWEVEVLLETDVATARRQVPARLGTLTEAPGGVLFTGRAENLDGMARVLAGWGWAFTVLRPDELRAEVIEYAARLSRYAERPGTRDD